MKFAFMSFSCPQLTLDEMLALANELGYDGIEPRLDKNHKHGVEITADDEARTVIREKASAAGIEICCLASSANGFGEPATAKDAIETLKPRVDLAADIGCGRIRIFGTGDITKISRETAIASASESMAEAAAYALEKGIVLCFETHDVWCEPSHMATVLENVSSPALMANWDIMHPVRAAKRTIDEAFDILRPWIAHVHVHDGIMKDDRNMSLVPIGEGEVDHLRAIERLQEMDYSGFISGEWIGWEPYEVHLPRELATLKSYL